MEFVLTLSKSFTTDSLGCAPLSNHHFILSAFQIIFFSFVKALDTAEGMIGGITDVEAKGVEWVGRRGTGSYSPSFSMGIASRRLADGVATWRRRKRRW